MIYFAVSKLTLYCFTNIALANIQSKWCLQNKCKYIQQVSAYLKKDKMLDIMSRKTKFNLFTVPKWFACDYEHECLSVYSTALRPKSAGIGSRSPMTLMRTRDLWTMRSLGCCGSSMTTMGSTLRSDFKKCQEKPTQKSWILLRVNRRHYKRWQVCTGSYLAWVWLWLLNSEHSQIHS